MLFYFLIFIVFISEIIIMSAIMIYLLKLDKKLNIYNQFIDEVKPLLKDMMRTVRELSEEFVKFAPKVVEKIKFLVFDFVQGQLKNLAGALTFWLVKKEVEKHV